MAIETSASSPLDLDDLGENIAELFSRIQAATHRLLVMLAEFDDREGWGEGFRSCAHWLSWRTGLDLGAAREKVRVARCLGHLPVISAALEQGRISYSKVRALTRVATPDNEEELLHIALAGTASQIESLVRSWRRVDRIEAAQREELRRSQRYLRLWTDEDGMTVLRGRLDPETAAVLRKALQAAGDALFEQDEDEGEPASAEQRACDAVQLIAASALQGGLDPGNGGDRYQVVVHTTEDALRQEGSEAVAQVEEVGDVSAETCRRLACDCSKVEMLHGKDSAVFDVGRKTRSIPPALRRALRSRDPVCRFPGCTSRFCQAHHIEHWADGGETKLENLLHLCAMHHRLVHEGGFVVDVLAEAVRFFRPDGSEVEGVPVLQSTRVDLGPADEIEIPPEVLMPSWQGEQFDIGMVIDGLRDAAGGELGRSSSG